MFSQSQIGYEQQKLDNSFIPNVIDRDPLCVTDPPCVTLPYCVKKTFSEENNNGKSDLNQTYTHGLKQWVV